MTNVRPLLEFVEDELPAFVDDKEDPDEWYVLIGDHVTEYSIWADEDVVEDYDEFQEHLQPEDRDANPNADDYMQIGTAGWLAECFDFGPDDDGFVGSAAWGEKVDRRLMNVLVVHESVLSDAVLETVHAGGQEPVEDSA